MIYTAFNPDDEGYLALAISVICEVTVENSFRLLEGQAIATPKNLSEEDLERISYLRGEGIKWDDIAEVFGMQTSAIWAAHKRWLKRNA